ncbi:membrane protein insertase YidC [Muribaculum intestinale]|uniref:Membrane protein insertase YidC n=2 Tax=Pseudomonadati TaxID=3379134 RepID=A0A4S2FYH6_9BACT|nr:membrane protein insertase YidC [Muribaculum intestinale]MYM12278.1 membrane protein insertase YidC [Muribaculum intestinale]TGY74527.1 membrane protein insertase YidC [Muribaculum intestinale]
MDKNTMYGMLLMGAVLLGFMWLNQPEPQPGPAPDMEVTQEQAQAAADNLLASPSDSLTRGQLVMLADAVARYGVQDSTGTGRIDRDGIVLTGNGTEVTGHVRVDSVDVPVGMLANPAMALTSSGISSRAYSDAVARVKTLLRDLTQYQGFARYLQGTNDTVRLANDLISLDISTKGAMIATAELSKYDSFRGGNVKVISGNDDAYSFILSSADREFDTRDFYFRPTEVTDSSVLMSLDLGKGTEFGLRYTLLPDSYVVRLDVEQKGMQSIIPSNVVTMDFVWRQRMIRQEEGRMFEERNSAIFYKYAGGDVDNLSETSSDSKEINEPVKWMAFKNQFFSMAFIGRTPFNNAALQSTVLSVNDDAEYLKEMEAISTLDYNPGTERPASFDILIGPNLYPMLSAVDKELYPDDDLDLTELVPLGWPIVRWINTLIVIPVFNILGSVFSNYGIIILILTIFIKLILFPFTYKSYMSQAKMRLLNPEIQAINEKYPGQENAMTRQQKTMELYSKAGANPMAGCLPMLLQFPVLIAMFAFFPSCIELRGQSFLWAKDLSAPDAILTWSGNIPLVTEYFGNHLSLFCLLMTVTNIIYTKFTMANQPSSSAMPGMKWMMYLMPLMFLVFFNNYAAGLSYYYFLSLLITIVQMYIFRHVVNEDKMRAKMAEAAKKPRKKSGFMARLEEAQRQQQAMLREQQKRQGGAGKRR